MFSSYKTKSLQFFHRLFFYLVQLVELGLVSGVLWILDNAGQLGGKSGNSKAEQAYVDLNGALISLLVLSLVSLILFNSMVRKKYEWLLFLLNLAIFLALAAFYWLILTTI